MADRTDPENRWEYRVWFDDQTMTEPFDDGGWASEGEEVRTDLYVLASERRGLLPKLRGSARFEVKERIERDGALEHWRVAVSEAFPLTAEGRTQAGRIVGDGPLSDAEAVSAEAVIAALEIRDQGLRLVETRKRRRRFHQRGGSCVGEWTLVEVPQFGATATTVGVEAADKAVLVEAVSALGLEPGTGDVS